MKRNYSHTLEYYCRLESQNSLELLGEFHRHRRSETPGKLALQVLHASRR